MSMGLRLTCASRAWEPRYHVCDSLTEAVVAIVNSIHFNKEEVKVETKRRELNLTQAYALLWQDGEVDGAMELRAGTVCAALIDLIVLDRVEIEIDQKSLLGFKYENSMLKVKLHSLSLTYNGNLFKFTALLISLVAGQTLEFFNIDNILSQEFGDQKHFKDLIKMTKMFSLNLPQCIRYRKRAPYENGGATPPCKTDALSLFVRIQNGLIMYNAS